MDRYVNLKHNTEIITYCTLMSTNIKLISMA